MPVQMQMKTRVRTRKQAHTHTQSCLYICVFLLNIYEYMCVLKKGKTDIVEYYKYNMLIWCSRNIETTKYVCGFSGFFDKYKV